MPCWICVSPMLPVTLTLMFGCDFWKFATIALKASFSEPWEKPSQRLIVTLGLLAGYASTAVIFCGAAAVLPAHAAAVRTADIAAAGPVMRRSCHMGVDSLAESWNGSG